MRHALSHVRAPLMHARPAHVTPHARPRRSTFDGMGEFDGMDEFGSAEVDDNVPRCVDTHHAASAVARSYAWPPSHCHTSPFECRRRLCLAVCTPNARMLTLMPLHARPDVRLVASMSALMTSPKRGPNQLPVVNQR